MLVNLLRHNADEVRETTKGEKNLLNTWLCDYGLYNDLYYSLINLSKRGKFRANIKFEIVDNDLFLDNKIKQTVCYIDNINIGVGHLGFMQTDISNGSIYETIQQLQTYLHKRWGCTIETRNKLEFDIIWK